MGRNGDRIEKFDGKPTSDFDGWLRSLEMRLEREGLWNVVGDCFKSERENRRSSSGSHEALSETRMESYKDPTVVMREGRVSALIIEALEKRPLAIVNNFLREPVEMLNRLKEQYSIADTLAKLEVQDKLFALDYGGGSIREYVEEYDGCVSGLLLAEPDFPQELIVKQFFESLRGLYDTPRLHLLRRQHLTDLHWDKVSRILVAEANIIANRSRNRKSTRSVAGAASSIINEVTGSHASDAGAVESLAKKEGPGHSHDSSESNGNEQNVHERVAVSTNDSQLVEKSKSVSAGEGLSKNALPGRENISLDERKGVEVPTQKVPISTEERSSYQQPLPALQGAERAMTSAQLAHSTQEPVEALESIKQDTTDETLASLRRSHKLRGLQLSIPRETGKPTSAERVSSESVDDEAGHRHVARDTPSTGKKGESDTETKRRADSRDVNGERNVHEREVQSVQKPKLRRSRKAMQRAEPEQGIESDSNSTETDTSTERNLVAEAERLSGVRNQHSSSAKSTSAGGSTSPGATAVGTKNVDGGTQRVLRSSIRASVAAQRKMTAKVSKPGPSEEREAPPIRKGAEGCAQSDIDKARVQSDPLAQSEIRRAPKQPKKMAIEPLVRRNRPSNSSCNDPGSDEQFAPAAREVRRHRLQSSGVEAPNTSAGKADIVKSPSGDGPSAAALQSSPVDHLAAKRRGPFHVPVHGEGSADDKESLGKEKGTSRHGPDHGAGRLKTSEERFPVLSKLINRRIPGSGKLRLIMESAPTTRTLSQPRINPIAMESSKKGHMNDRSIGDALRASPEVQRGSDQSGSAGEKMNNSVDKRGSGQTLLRASPVPDEYQIALERQLAEQRRIDLQASAHTDRKRSASAQRATEVRSSRDPRAASAPSVKYRGADPRLQRKSRDGPDAVQVAERKTNLSQESTAPRNVDAGTIGTEALQAEEEAGKSADALGDGSVAKLGKENLPSETEKRSLTKPGDRDAPHIAANTSPNQDTSEAQALNLAHSQNDKQVELGAPDLRGPSGPRIRNNQQLSPSEPTEKSVARDSMSNHARPASAGQEVSSAEQTDKGMSVVAREAEGKVKDEPRLSDQSAAPEGQPNSSSATALDADYTGQKANKPTGIARTNATKVKDEPVLRRDHSLDVETHVSTASNKREQLLDSQSVRQTGRQGSAFPRQSSTPFGTVRSGNFVGDSNLLSKRSATVDTAKELSKKTTPEVGVGSNLVAEKKIVWTTAPAASEKDPHSWVDGAESPTETVDRNLSEEEPNRTAKVGEAGEAITPEKHVDQVKFSDEHGSGGGKKVVWAKELTREYALTEHPPSADIETNVIDDQHSKEVGAVSMRTPEDSKAPIEDANEDYDYEEDYEYPLEETRVRNKHARKKKRDTRDQDDVELCATCKRAHPGTCRYNPALNSKRRKRLEKKSKFLEKIKKQFEAEEITKAN
eukprot:CAMPEP_0113956406 /NCGR_PEP_ID=MMETSP0011_2-20120614/2045_1 /TAXON_ID=101924 /ORGANISM="Rhodosorus marinus" /LENGTH=1437 /DNA_ID=CAMNT_0000966551 /DNA_START=264 /DNA_END=4577 /DNA_ORIENTATION=+ /assembly_acc=CAM_ASM_000156